MCVWWRTYLLHIWIRETEETAAIMTPLYLFFFSRLLWHISDQMRSYNWLYGRSPSWSNVSVYRLMSPYCQRSRYRNKSDQVIIYCWFNTGEVFTDRGSGLSHYSPAEEIMTCRCSAVAAKLVFLFFSFLFFYYYTPKLPCSPPAIPPPAARQSRLPLCYITGNVFFLELMSLFSPLFCLSCCFGETSSL